VGDPYREIGTAEVNRASSQEFFFKHEAQSGGLERFPFPSFSNYKGFGFN
jgi:hypothetical protein